MALASVLDQAPLFPNVVPPAVEIIASSVLEFSTLLPNIGVKRKGFCLLFCLLGNETGHQPVGDGGSYPYFGEHIVGEFVARLQHDVDIVEQGDEAVDDEDHPEVALGVGLPFLTRVEKGEHEEE